MPISPAVIERNIKIAQRRLGVPDDGIFGPVTTAEFLRRLDLADAAVRDEHPRFDTIPTGSNADVSIEERATAWCEREAQHWGTAQVSLKRTAEYFGVCEPIDGSEGKIEWLVKTTLEGQRHSFCGAAQGYAERQVLMPGEDPLPARPGAKDYRGDAISRLRGPYVTVSRILSGSVARPPRGSLAIYDRPSTEPEWDGHIRRVRSSKRDGYMGVGANENDRRWRMPTIAWPYTDKDLLGFVYPKGFVL